MKNNTIPDVCTYQEYGMSEDFITGVYCAKYLEKRDDIHYNMKCSRCPDFKPYEHTMGTNENKDLSDEQL